MEQKLSKLKNLLFRSQTIDCPDHSNDEPQIGFKLTFNINTKQLTIKIIGARQLPTAYGNIKPQGYVVKVRVFPEREKFETTPARESWPTYNEEFIFDLQSIKSTSDDYFKGKFVSFTVYAILEMNHETGNGGTTTKPRSTLKRFLSFNDYEENVMMLKRRSTNRNPLNSRRTIGAVTYNLDMKLFTQNRGGVMIATPDIWRNIKEITSGIQTGPREGKKGAIETTLSYDISEDGKNDTIEITVTKFRCSLQTMQEHEKIGGQLYIKITAYECEDVIQKMKSDRFEPTISLKLDTNTTTNTNTKGATLRATVNNYNIEQVKVLIRLISRNIVGKKTILGRIEIDRHSDLWKEIVSMPSTPITRMINFE